MNTGPRKKKSDVLNHLKDTVDDNPGLVFRFPNLEALNSCVFQEFVDRIGSTKVDDKVEALRKLESIISDETYRQLDEEQFLQIKACFELQDNRVHEAAVRVIARAFERTSALDDLIDKDFDVFLFDHVVYPRAVDGIAAISQCAPGIWDGRYKPNGCLAKMLDYHKRWAADGEHCVNVVKVFRIALEGGAFTTQEDIDILGQLAVTMTSRISKNLDQNENELWIEEMYEFLFAVKNESVFMRILNDTDFFQTRLRDITLAGFRHHILRLVFEMMWNSAPLMETLLERTPVLTALHAAIHWSATSSFIKDESILGDLLCVLLERSETARSELLTAGQFHLLRHLNTFADSTLERKIIVMRVCAVLVHFHNVEADSFISHLPADQLALDLIAIDDTAAAQAGLQFMYDVLQTPEIPEQYTIFLSDESRMQIEAAMQSDSQEVTDLARLVYDTARSRLQ